MTKVLVTGANGFVGKHLVHELVEGGYEVLAVGGHSLPELTDAESVTNLTVDLSNVKEVEAIDLSDVHAVIHLAGLAAVGPSFDDPMNYITTNAALEVNLFQRAIAQGAKPRFIIVSSGSLYNPHIELPITEQSSVDPNSPYAVSKITQEQMAHYYASRGFEVVIARPFNHIGPGQGLGFLVPDLAKQIVAYEKGESDQILVGNLDAKRDYTDVRDIVSAYRLLLEKGKPGETYNICTGTALSGHDILKQLLSATSMQPNIVQDPAKMRPSDAPEIYGSHQKITNDTGWQPNHAIEQTVQDVLADWHNR